MATVANSFSRTGIAPTLYKSRYHERNVTNLSCSSFALLDLSDVFDAQRLGSTVSHSKQLCNLLQVILMKFPSGMEFMVDLKAFD